MLSLQILQQNSGSLIILGIAIASVVGWHFQSLALPTFRIYDDLRKMKRSILQPTYYRWSIDGRALKKPPVQLSIRERFLRQFLLHLFLVVLFALAYWIPLIFAHRIYQSADADAAWVSQASTCMFMVCITAAESYLSIHLMSGVWRPFCTIPVD